MYCLYSGRTAFSVTVQRSKKPACALDRKSSALKRFSRRVIPGSSANSMVYHRLSGEEYGPQMPPKGSLRAEQVAIIKAWIDQGADWPESLANEADLPPLNPQAVGLVESLRKDDLPAFMKAVQADPKLSTRADRKAQLLSCMRSFMRIPKHSPSS